MPSVNLYLERLFPITEDTIDGKRYKRIIPDNVGRATLLAGFSKADSNNLPTLTVQMFARFFRDHPDMQEPEYCHEKAGRLKRF